MPVFRTRRERRLWLLAGTLVLAIYASAYFVRFMLDALQTRGVLRLTIWTVFGACAAVVVAFLLRARPGGWEIALLLAAAGAYLLMLRHLTIIQERFHLIQYGALGGLCYAALRERWQLDADPVASDLAAAAAPAPAPVARRRWQRWPALWAILLGGIAGWGDELVQGILPNRVYDLRDVVTNTQAAALLVVVLAARRGLRAAVPAASPSPPAATT